MQEFNTPNEALLFLAGKRAEQKMTWEALAEGTGFDLDRIRRWVNGQSLDNTFVVQCIGDIVGFDLSVRLTFNGAVLVDSCVNRKIGEAFLALRTMSGMSLGNAAKLAHSNAQALGHFEDGKVVSQGSYMPFDKMQSLAEGLGGKLTIVLRPRRTAKREATMAMAQEAA